MRILARTKGGHAVAVFGKQIARFCPTSLLTNLPCSVDLRKHFLSSSPEGGFPLSWFDLVSGFYLLLVRRFSSSSQLLLARVAPHNIAAVTRAFSPSGHSSHNRLYTAKERWLAKVSGEFKLALIAIVQKQLGNPSQIRFRVSFVPLDFNNKLIYELSSNHSRLSTFRNSPISFLLNRWKKYRQPAEFVETFDYHFLIRTLHP